MKKIKQERGITLIALVITIIVLLILAGVAISMLSGENGILTRAAEAKEDTEGAQKEEETNLTSMDLDSYFIINNLKYKCAYGYVTGIDTGEKVINLENALKGTGYTVATKYNFNTKQDENITDEEKESLNLATGMGIEKDDQIVARVVLFGDYNGEDGITGVDGGYLSSYLVGSRSPVILEAMDVNHDGIIDKEDANILELYSIGKAEIDQYKYVSNKKDLVIIDNNYLVKDYIENGLPEAFKNQTKYKFEYDNEKETYVFKGATAGTNVSEITELLPNVVIKKERETVEQIEDECYMEITINNTRVIKRVFDIEL